MTGVSFPRHRRAARKEHVAYAKNNCDFPAGQAIRKLLSYSQCIACSYYFGVVVIVAMQAVNIEIY